MAKKTYTKIDLTVKKTGGDEHFEVGKFKRTGDAIISANALGKSAPANYEYSVKATSKYKKGANVASKKTAKKGDYLYSNTGVRVKVLDFDTKFGGRVLIERADGIDGGKPLWRPLNKFNETKKYLGGGVVTNVNDETASSDLKEEITKKAKKGDVIIHFGYTDYGGTFMDKAMIEYFIKNHPKNIVWEHSAYNGKNAFVFGKPAKDFSEEAKSYPLGYEDTESFYYEMESEEERKSYQEFIKDVKRNYKVSPKTLDWLMENRSGYYKMDTTGLDFNYEDLIEELKKEGLVSESKNAKKKFNKGGNTPSKWCYEIGGL